MNQTKLWRSGYPDVALVRPCQIITQHDRNTTATASEVIVASATALFYLVVFALSILGVWVKPCAKLCSSRGTFFVFFIGLLVASVNVFTSSDNFVVKLYFRSSTVFVIGIAFTLFGAALFFSLPEEHANEATLGRQQPSMGCVVSLITFPLFAMEAVLLVLAAADGPNIKTETTELKWILVIVDKSLFLVQKPIQVGIYLYLRNTIACLEYRESAQFYFRIISFFNLIEWVDSQVNVDSDVQLSGVQEKLDGWSGVFSVAYKALIIDYRLLCCLLFLEHSLEIQTEVDEAPDEAAEMDNGLMINNMTSRDQLKRCSGYFVGCMCLTAPVFCGLFYLHLHIRASVQIFAIMVNVAIVIVGIFFLRKNDLEEGENREALGVKIMVSLYNIVPMQAFMSRVANLSS